MPDEAWFAISAFQADTKLMENLKEAPVYPPDFRLFFVDKEENFANMMKDLNSSNEAAVDVKCHNIHSYAGT